MKIARLFILLACIAFIIACKEPVIDASSSETMESSSRKILSSLPDAEKKQFSHAYHSIIFSYGGHAAFREQGDTKDIIQKRLERKIDGLNSSQVIDEYKKVRKKRGLWGIQKSEESIIKTKEDKKQLDLVTIDKYKLYMAKDGRLDRMYMDLVIHNGSKYKILGATFLIRIGSSNNDTLLPRKRNIYIHIPEGLEKGGLISKKIDLGYPSSYRYLPKNPILSEYSTSRISGNEMDISSNIFPKLSDLEKRLELKKREFDKEFGTK